MDKLVILKLVSGSLEKGFSVMLQIGADGQRSSAERPGNLPAAPTLNHTFQRWQVAYQHLSIPYRLEARDTGFAKNLSRVDDCFNAAKELSKEFNQWLNSEAFRSLHNMLLTELNKEDKVRIIIQTHLAIIQHLPWHTWTLIKRYQKAEIALSTLSYEIVENSQFIKRKTVRVLAVLGHSQGINIQLDKESLQYLPNAKITFLEKPSRDELAHSLMDERGWDILFFAGHSVSNKYSQTEVTGRLYINPEDSLTISELSNALKKAIRLGVKIAIFNSCDGLGLAQELADLQIPQIVVMREPVPDQVAHEFLKYFLRSFAGGESLYLAVRQAREALQSLEDRYPCATWLPMICQNPAEFPPTWSTLTNIVQETDVKLLPKSRLQRYLTTSLISCITSLIPLGLSQIGVFQSWNLGILDKIMQLRPHELPDARILVVAITETDLQAQNSENRKGSLSDKALLALLEKLEAMQPRVIGLDIYRDFPVGSQQPQLKQQLIANDKLLATCKTSNGDKNFDGIAPPIEVPDQRIGFSDFVADFDGILRRHLLALTPEPASPCQASYSLNTLLALTYLSQEGLEITTSPKGYLQVEDIIFKPLEPNSGGYKGADVGGHQVLLNYRQLASPDQIAAQVTLNDVLDDRVNEEKIRDHIILIGATHSVSDNWLTPYSDGKTYEERETAGVFMQAHMVSQLLSAVLDKRPLIQTWPEWADSLWIISWAAVSSSLVYGIAYKLRVNPKLYLFWLLMGGIMLEFGLFGVCWLGLVQIGYWLPWGGAAVSIVTSMAGAIAWQEQNKVLLINGHHATT